MLLRAKPDVLFQQVDDEGVLLSLQEEVYFGVNEPAARVWQLLQEAPRDVQTIVAHLAAEYPDAPPATLEQDVAELLTSLETNGLVERIAGDVDILPRPTPVRLTRAS